MGKHTAKVSVDREVLLWQPHDHPTKIIRSSDTGRVTLTVDMPGFMFAPQNIPYVRRNLYREVDAILDAMEFQP